MKLNPDNIISLYKSGLSMQKIADSIGTTMHQVRMIVLKSGTELNHYTNERANVPVEEIKAAYLAGDSVKQIAARYGVARHVITNRLNKMGIQQRDRSQSMYNRMAHTSFEERQKLVAKANETVRSLPKEFHAENAAKQAIAKQKTLSKVGVLEREVISFLKKFGLKAIPQLAIGPYNIDIACGKVAIEIHNTPTHPHSRPGLPERIEYLLKRGWTVIYIKIARRCFLEPSTLYKIALICESTCLNPSLDGQYWVVRGTGEALAAGRLDGDNFTVIPVSESCFYHFWGNGD